MRYIYVNNLIHRDLKHSNILLSRNKHVCVSDFGLAKEHDLKILQAKGTPRFMAPELFDEEDRNAKSQNKYDNKVDAYSFGITLFILSPENAQTTILKQSWLAFSSNCHQQLFHWLLTLFINVYNSCLAIVQHSAQSSTFLNRTIYSMKQIRRANN